MMCRKSWFGVGFVSDIGDEFISGFYFLFYVLVVWGLVVIF